MNKFSDRGQKSAVIFQKGYNVFALSRITVVGNGPFLTPGDPSETINHSTPSCSVQSSGHVIWLTWFAGGHVEVDSIQQV